MRTMEVKQKVFNVSAVRLAINVRKNLKNFPPDMQADFLTMSAFIEDFSDEKPNGNEKRSTDTERDITN